MGQADDAPDIEYEDREPLLAERGTDSQVVLGKERANHAKDQWRHG